MIVLQGRRRKIERLAWSPDGAVLAAGGLQHGVELWRPADRKPRPVRLPPETRSAAGLGVLADGRVVAVNKGFDVADRRVWVWSPPDGPLVPFPDADMGLVRGADVHASGLVAVVLWAERPVTHTLTVYRAGAEGVAPVWSQPLSDGLHPVRFFPSGDRLVHAERNPDGVGRVPTRILIRDVSDGRELTRIPDVPEAPDHIAVSDDGRLLAALDQWAVRAWDLARPDRQLVELPMWTNRCLTGLALDPAGRLTAVTCNDETVRLYETATWGVARQFAWEAGRMRSVAFSPDGARAAAGSDTGRVVVWDVDL
jgi:WD40 repeat protein